MEPIICACCGQSFPPDPRVKNQTYCAASRPAQGWSLATQALDMRAGIHAREQSRKGRKADKVAVTPLPF